MRIRRLIDGNPPRQPTGKALAAPALVFASFVGLALAALGACSGDPPPAASSAGAAEAPAVVKLDIPWLPPALSRWESAIVTAANHNGVDPDAVAILALIESCGDPKAKSPSGALGLMQIMPNTAVLIAKERGIEGHSTERLLDPAYNLDLGASYFGKQLKAFDEKDEARAVDLAAAAYNGGEVRVRDWLNGRAELSKETEGYRALVTGMWAERRAARSATYDTWRERIRGKMALRAGHPLPGARVTLTFGASTPGTGAAHEGLDLAAAAGTSVLAPLDGTVDRIEKNAKGEPVLVVVHGAGMESRYRHLSSVKVSPGTTITRGDVIGEVGSPEGGPHVHFEMRDNGELIDPTRYLGATTAPANP